MTITTIRPFSTVQQGEWIKEPPAAASFHGLLVDDSETTYALASRNLDTDYEEGVVGLDRVTLPSGDLIRAVRVRGRIFSNGNGIVRVGQRYNNATRYDDLPYSANRPILTSATPWQKVAPDNSLWSSVSASQFLKLALRTSGWASSDDNINLYEVYLDIEHFAAPTVTIDTASTVTVTQPTILWTYAQADGFDQESYELEVVQNGEVIWSSGEVISNAKSYKMEMSLLNGSYTTRLRVSSKWGGAQKLRSVWVEKALTVDAPVAVAPTVATFDGAEPGTVRVNITPGAGTPAAEFFTVERSLDRETWSTVAEEATATNPLNLYDLEVVPGRLTYYRVFAIRYNAGDKLVTAPVEASITYLLDEWVLRDHKSDLGYMTLDVEQNDLDIDQSEDMATFNPLGIAGNKKKTGAVTVKDTLRGDKFSVTIGMLGTEPYDQFKAFREAQRTLVLQAPVIDGRWYFVFGPTVKNKIINMNDPVYRQITFDVVEVDNVPD